LFKTKHEIYIVVDCLRFVGERKLNDSMFAVP